MYNIERESNQGSIFVRERLLAPVLKTLANISPEERVSDCSIKPVQSFAVNGGHNVRSI